MNNYFNYSAKKINKMIAENKAKGMTKATMICIHDDLIELKPLIEKLYKDKIFYLSYWKSECGWHGWRWDRDDGTMEGWADITDSITDKFLEIYALILTGLGETMNEVE